MQPLADFARNALLCKVRFSLLCGLARLASFLAPGGVFALGLIWRGRVRRLFVRLHGGSLSWGGGGVGVTSSLVNDYLTIDGKPYAAAVRETRRYKHKLYNDGKLEQTEKTSDSRQVD